MNITKHKITHKGKKQKRAERNDRFARLVAVGCIVCRMRKWEQMFGTQKSLLESSNSLIEGIH